LLDSGGQGADALRFRPVVKTSIQILDAGCFQGPLPSLLLSYAPPLLLLDPATLLFDPLKAFALGDLGNRLEEASRSWRSGQHRRARPEWPKLWVSKPASSTHLPNGSDSQSRTRSRVVIHRSLPPIPPGRSDPKIIVLPSNDRLGVASMNSVLSGGPALTGADHGWWAF
jgi:hypothetical protein